MSRPQPARLEVTVEDLGSILERVRAVLAPSDYEQLASAIATLAWLASELEKKKASLARIRAWLFGGNKSEKASKVLPQEDAADAAGTEQEASSPAKKVKRKGHGRNGAAAYTGAERHAVAHDTLQSGNCCPECRKGRVYAQTQPHVLVRFKGQAPIDATVYELETLRCNLCGELYPAEAPADVGEEKYDASTASTIAVLHYGSGLPFYRLQKLQHNLGIPLPATTQWEIVAKAAGLVFEVYEELIRQAAQGDIIHNDDTTMKVLALAQENEQNKKANPKARTGMFTSGIVSTSEKYQIALFFTGRKHAGENLEQVLKRRLAQRAPPIQMCDGLSRNLPAQLKTVLANCLAHGRRKFVEIVDNFPAECRHVIEVLGEVYKHDAISREQKMSAQERLHFHQAQSGELMADLKLWMTEQIESRQTEPSSSLGKAISYMLNRWDELTLFLRKPGAPLDNNICERALKKAVLNRKNSLFYKTENGARVGDIFMSLIHTAVLSGANPVDYLTALQKCSEHLQDRPQEWMPWNYQAAVAALPAEVRP